MKKKHRDTHIKANARFHFRVHKDIILTIKILYQLSSFILFALSSLASPAPHHGNHHGDSPWGKHHSSEPCEIPTPSSLISSSTVSSPASTHPPTPVAAACAIVVGVTVDSYIVVIPDDGTEITDGHDVAGNFGIRFLDNMHGEALVVNNFVCYYSTAQNTANAACVTFDVGLDENVFVEDAFDTATGIKVNCTTILSNAVYPPGL
jgi:hypothetical protein